MTLHLSYPGPVLGRATRSAGVASLRVDNNDLNITPGVI